MKISDLVQEVDKLFVNYWKDNVFKKDCVFWALEDKVKKKSDPCVLVNRTGFSPSGMTSSHEARLHVSYEVILKADKEIERLELTDGLFARGGTFTVPTSFDWFLKISLCGVTCDPAVKSEDWKVSFKVLTHQAKMHP